MVDEVKINGLSELQALLDTLPAKLEANIMRGALRAGAKILYNEVKATAPVGPTNSENARLYGGYTGALRDSTRITTRVKDGKVMASVVVGGKTKNGADVFYAHMIEFTGGVAHDIKPKSAKSLFIAGIFGKIVHHPGFQPKPFMRPAMDRKAQEAVLATGEYIKKRLANKEGLDTADIILEGDE